MLQNLTLLDLLLKGGPVFILILAVSVISVSVMIERLMAVASVRKNSDRLRKQILARVHSGKWEEAVVLCKENSGMVSDVYLAALDRRHAERPVIEEAV